ncbi:MAG: hypothetical protein AB8G22_16685, partial [Saprospiraceae bacterium]
MRWLLFIIGCCFCGSTVIAQKLSPRELKRNGKVYFNNYHYYKAYDHLQNYYQINPKDNDIWESLGIAAYHVNQLAVAQQLLQKVTENNR